MTLQKTARAYGIETVYTTIDGRQCEAKEEVLELVLKALGVSPKETPESITHSVAPAPPIQAFLPDSKEKRWGVFLPLYALHSRRSWGGGDFTDMENLIDWVADLGGSVVGTLPLLASFLDQPFSPSPYLPASRLFWNEFFLDVEKIPELEITPDAHRLIARSEFQDELKHLRRQKLIDYRQQMDLKRRILEMLADVFFQTETPRRGIFHQFLKNHPDLDHYSRFRASEEKRVRYHQFVQWLVNEQMQGLERRADRKGVSLYLDFPLGVHADSYDVRRFDDLFIKGISIGAPPDPFFAGGQNWGFPPLHPFKIHDHGSPYLIDCFRNHLQFAHILRIDHVMGLHRQFWIPHGFGAADGVYVRYPSEELYHLLCTESQRQRTIIVGEDLGTVPPELRPTMKKHHILRSYVSQFDDISIPPEIPKESVASLNTHDMPPFAALWKESDKAHSALLRNFERLARSSAMFVLINLEDLWLEDQPQNIPGTSDEYPNWRRKARFSLEEFQNDSNICDLLQQVNQWRRQRA